MLSVYQMRALSKADSDNCVEPGRPGWRSQGALGRTGETAILLFLRGNHHRARSDSDIPVRLVPAQEYVVFGNCCDLRDCSLCIACLENYRTAQRG